MKKRLVPAIPALVFAILVPLSLRAQTQAQISVADRFISALMEKNWKELYVLSSPALLSQMDSTKYGMIADQIETALGRLRHRWLASAEMQRGYAVTLWHAQFEKDSVGLQVIIDSLNKTSGIWIKDIGKGHVFTVPPYADTTRFTERDVVIGSSKLPGTLSLPDGQGPFPLVVMVQGSGPSDRDETVKGNKPFRDIAWGLASRGIAVFRYDKRTYVHPEEFDTKTQSVEEEVMIDAVGALRTLSAQPLIDSRRVFLLGHSLGAMLAPDIAKRAEVVDAIIMLAPPARDLVTVTIDQLRFMKGLTDSSNVNALRKLDTQIALGEKILAGKAELRDNFLGASADYYYKLNSYHQVETAKSLRIPIFIATAGKDYQVSATDRDIWHKALDGRYNVTFKDYPECYHLFIPTDEKPGPQNYDQQGHVTPKLIDDLVTWIGKH